MEYSHPKSFVNTCRGSAKSAYPVYRGNHGAREPLPDSSQHFTTHLGLLYIVRLNLLGIMQEAISGRIAIRFKPSFKLTVGGKSFDVHPKYLKTIHKADGYEYSS
jgi:hypothetical protein